MNVKSALFCIGTGPISLWLAYMWNVVAAHCTAQSTHIKMIYNQESFKTPFTAVSEGNVKQQWIPNTLNPEHPTSSRSPLQQHHWVPLRRAGSCSATGPRMESMLVLTERKTCPGQTFFLRAGASHVLAHYSHMHIGSCMNMHFTTQSYPTWCGCGIKTITGLLLKEIMGDIFIYKCVYVPLMQ